MTRRGGSRFAYRASELVAYIDDHSDLTTDGTPKRTRRTINRIPMDQETDARTIRRWRSGRFEGVTRPAARRLLSHYYLTLEDFEYQHPNAILRGTA